MNIGSVSATNGQFSTQAAVRKPEASEVQKGGRDADGDSDDGAVKSAPPTVNTSGQKIGQHISVKA